MKWYKYPLLNEEYIKFRTLSAEEADKFYGAIISENPYAEEFIFDLITDNKCNIDELNAGIVTGIVYCSFKLSGYFSKHEDVITGIDNARELHKNNVYHKLFYSKIMKIIPGVYKLEDLKDKSVNELLELYVLAEAIIDAEIHDTNKMKEALAAENKPINKSKSKILNMITKEELISLQASLQAEEYDGMPISGL